jgi:hypothetical protein
MSIVNKMFLASVFLTGHFIMYDLHFSNHLLSKSSKKNGLVSQKRCKTSADDMRNAQKGRLKQRTVEKS